ncbi:tRNA epoxyqueuosine(34) reductase QueG [Thalassoglobus sp.]|uniref:tRNA epoxyqueuosine(34) reductase QueG n=1 Tax=Thalassoglobus sp. TaxID=2795869 RepID=UPI003AA92792
MTNAEETASAEIASRIKREAKAAGFSLVGIAPAARPDTLEFLHQWLAEGKHGEMGYMSRRKDAYTHPDGVLPDVCSLILLGMNYFNEPDSSEKVGKIAKYASGSRDYHDLLRKKLKQLSKVLHELSPGCKSRCVVDTAPLLERDFARMAGLGWFGKNTMLINKQKGSFFFLGGILSDVTLPADQPHETSHCGTCTRCLEACPTDAFNGPYDLDARKCISYLTIELRGQPIPNALRPQMEDWLFGCDVCQDVCPWNRKSEVTHEADLIPDLSSPRDAISFLMISEEEFQLRFRKTPFSRTGRDGMARNAAIVLGNAKLEESIFALEAGIEDNSEIVRGACAWALGQFSNTQTREILARRKSQERDRIVLNEIDLALGF